MHSIWHFFTRPRGARYWRPFLWSTAAVGLAGIPLVTLFPTTVPLVWLWLVGIPANSPISPLFPTAFEPLMMDVVKYQPVLTVAIVATGIFVHMEFINWYVFSWVLGWDSLEKLRHNKWVRFGLKHFARAPYWTVFFFAATPIPFWVVRCLAILHRLNFGKYMVVMAVGRFPRLVIYAWIGDQLRIPSVALIALAVGTGVILIAWKLLRKQPLLADSGLEITPQLWAVSVGRDLPPRATDRSHERRNSDEPRAQSRDGRIRTGDPLNLIPRIHGRHKP